MKRAAFLFLPAGLVSLALSYVHWLPGYEWVSSGFSWLTTVFLGFSLLLALFARAWRLSGVVGLVVCGVVAHWLTLPLFTGKELLVATVALPEKDKTLYIISPEPAFLDYAASAGEPHLYVYERRSFFPWVRQVAHYEVCVFQAVEKTNTGILLKTEGIRCPREIPLTIQ